MPVLEPNPTDGHKKLLQMAALIAGVMIVISIVATIAAQIG
ncbi:SGM_5486 family transporter-associated protein [Streptacidiphilus monticola]|uniref:SGM_5486 family transporter-associated protein n=1 Tax=Streptacidiphilus monticola TaxID=2161674 RepID=A0ABW1FZ82_9ACTN